MFPAGPILAALAGMGIGRVTGGLVGALAGAVFREYEAEIWGNDPGERLFSLGSLRQFGVDIEGQGDCRVNRADECLFDGRVGCRLR